jgi:membrane-bound metal-dependent hydrolase YbcI (DUF457 family)
MDILAHFLWAYALYWGHPYAWLAGILGTLPDIIPFIPSMLYQARRGTLHFGKPDIKAIPHWVHTLYAFTHSLVIFALVAGALFLLWPVAFWLLGGWLLHILLDIPTHEKDFFPTPFLWPLSNYTVDGVTWATRWVMVTNYTALLAAYAWLLLRVPGPFW